MSAPTPTVLEIDRKLRDDFRRRAKDFGISTETTDPLLAVLFRTVAQQIDGVYSGTALLRQSLLHELMRGLHMETFLARPAQAVVRLEVPAGESRVLRAGTELHAVAAGGERLLFSLDATTEVSGARLAMALGYRDQSLRLLSGVAMSEEIEALRPSLDAVPVALGPEPALFLAFDGVGETGLGRHGLFFELGPGSYAVEHALAHEPWWVVGERGELAGAGLLRPRRGQGGVFHLERTVRPAGAAADRAAATPAGDAEVLPERPAGFYSGRLFVLPEMPEAASSLCRAPRLLEAVLPRLVTRWSEGLMLRPRLWIRIAMPPGVPPLEHAIHGIVLNAITVSNVFVRNQTVQFARDGVSVPLGRETAASEHLVAPIAVTSTDNQPYVPGNRPGRDATVGRFELANGRLTVTPGARADGSADDGVNVRLWLTNGTLGNGVGPGDIAGFAQAATLAGVRVVPLTAAAGGSDGEEMASEERRFAEALLTRGRIVTRRDLETAALALDRRVVGAESRGGLERGEGGGLGRVERLLVSLDGAAFAEPEIELGVLKEQMERSLRERLVEGVRLEVSFQWA